MSIRFLASLHPRHNSGYAIRAVLAKIARRAGRREFVDRRIRLPRDQVDTDHRSIVVTAGVVECHAGLRRLKSLCQDPPTQMRKAESVASFELQRRELAGQCERLRTRS